MRNITLYVEENTLIHRISPITKLYYILTSILIPIVLNNMKISLIIITINILILITAKVIKHTLKLLTLNIILIISIILIQGLFNPNNETQVFNLGIIIFYEEGLLVAFKIVLRLLNIISSFSILIFTTKPFEIVEALENKGFSPKIGYILNSVLQIIPNMMNTTDRILNAQKSRGLETQGSIINRIKAFIPLIGPIVLSSLINTRERAMALEVRGFNSKTKKTFLSEYKSYRYDTVSKYLSLIFILISITWRILYG